MWRKLQEEQSTSPNPIRRRNIIRRIFEAVKKRVTRNPRRNMREIAKELRISDRLLRRNGKEDLDPKPYPKIQRWHISSSTKAKSTWQREENSGGDSVPQTKSSFGWTISLSLWRLWSTYNTIHQETSAIMSAALSAEAVKYAKSNSSEEWDKPMKLEVLKL